MEKKYDFRQQEQNIQELWDQEQIYQSRTKDDRPTYSIDTPPPTVSGALHIGHIFSYTQTDIIARYKRMSGFSVFYPFGFDDNGLPTERFVETKRGVTAQQFSRTEFIRLCLEETTAVEEQFKSLWQRMGLSVDWSKCYSTISEMARRISQDSFIQLYKKGYVYRKDEPALYCTTCQTSVAQAELDDVQEPSVFYDIQFSASFDSAQDETGKLIIATTRPELLSSCVALLYNPQDSRYQHLKDTKVQVPWFNYEVPVLADEQVVMDKGTGLVMCCTFGDKTDVAWFKKFNLPYRPSIGRDGRWLPSTGILSGLKAKDARKAIIEALTQDGLVVQQRPITHAISVHERCKKPIEFLVLKQWFLKLLPYKNDLLACADKINWYPNFMKARYKDWVEHLNWDWCLSRQRFYGIPFPAWHCDACGETILASEDQLPIDPQENQHGGSCPSCKGKLQPDTDVMDTWNTSSLTPYICKALYEGDDRLVFKQPYTPMSMRPQAHDIIRTWAFYTITKTWMHHGMIPWHDIVISGHVLSNAKEKISKSRGNSALQPENLLNAYPADVIRYWTASGTLGHDVAFSEDQLKIGNRLLTKLWNAFLFIGEHTQESRFDVCHEQIVSKKIINEWIIHQVDVCFADYQRYFDQHEFGLALDRVEKFFWNDVCDNYLELIKDQLFNPTNYVAAMVDETRKTLYALGLRALQLYAPFMPHITEVIYQALYKSVCHEPSLHVMDYIQKKYVYRMSDEHLRVMHQILHVVATVRKLKTDQKLSLKTDLAQLTISGPQKLLDQLREQEALLKGVTRAQVIEYEEASFDNAQDETVNDGVRDEAVKRNLPSRPILSEALAKSKDGMEQRDEQWFAWVQTL